MKTTTLAIFCILLRAVMPGCINSPVAYRGVVYHTTQEATTDGVISNEPYSGDATSNADKQLTDSINPNIKLPAKESTK